MNTRSIPNYRLYREKTGEYGDFWLHCETIPVRSQLHNWEISVHRHAALFQIFWVQQGEGALLRHGQAALPFKAPCAVFIAPGAAHGFRFVKGVDGLVITGLADRLSLPASADPSVADYVDRTRITAFAQDESIEEEGRERQALDRLFADIHREIAGYGIGREVLLEAFVTEVIVLLARAEVQAQPAQDGASRRDNSRMQKLELLIAAHFREHRPVQFFAEKIGVSPAHLNRLARQATGASVSQLLSRRLLEAARRDLIFTPTPIQTIAYSLGFQDPAYFNRFFRRQTGMTPGSYRNAERRRLAG